jgi:hypothetical protein
MSLNLLNPFMKFASGGGAAGIGMFEEITRVSPTSASDTVTTSAFTSMDNLMVLWNGIPDSTSDYTGARVRFGDGGVIDSGTSYAQMGQRDSAGAASGGSRTNVSFSLDPASTAGKEEWGVLNMINEANEIKTWQSNCICNDGLGSSNGLTRGVVAGKWIEKTNVANKVEVYNSESGSHDYSTDSELIVLGYDADGSNSGDSFFQTIQTDTLTSAATTFDSAQISSPKKYYFVEATFDSTNSSGVILMSVGFSGSISGAGANRYNEGFGTDGTQTSLGTNYGIVAAAGQSRVYVHALIVNNSAREKLIMTNGITTTGTSSSTAPVSMEGCFKCVTTGSQIDMFRFHNADGHNLDNGTMTIYGSD